MAGKDRTIAVSLLCVIGVLVVFGSLYPFSFAPGSADPIDLARRLSFAGTTQSDVAANVLLYLPLGACLAWLAAARFGGFAAVAVATLGGAALSFGIEFAQLYETRRVASLADLSANTVGAFVGGWFALAIAAAARHPPHAPALAAILRHPVAAAILLSWIGYRLAPFVPVIDADKWSGALAPLAGGGWQALGGLLPHLLAWLILVTVCGRLAPDRPLKLAALVMVTVLSGRVLFSGLALEAAEIAGMAAALALSVPLARLPAPHLAMSLAAALLVLIAVQGLAPFDFQLAQDRFTLLPFDEMLSQYRATNLPDSFLRCFMIGALVWLLAQGGLPLLTATALGASALLSIEILQLWLPARRAGITDPLLAVVAGGLLAVFETGRSPAT